MWEKKREGSSSVVEGLTSAQPSPAQRPAAEPREAPRLQSARWPGLGASSSGSLCESANPREEKRLLGLGRPVRRQRAKASKTIPLTVVCLACAPQTKSWERKKHGEQWGAPRFFLFSSRSLGKQKDNQTMRLFRCAAADLRLCMGFFFWAGAESGSRPGLAQGDRFLRPQDTRRQSPSSQLSILNRRLERRNVVVGQQGFFRAGGRG